MSVDKLLCLQSCRRRVRYFLLMHCRQWRWRQLLHQAWRIFSPLVKVFWPCIPLPLQKRFIRISMRHRGFSPTALWRWLHWQIWDTLPSKTGKWELRTSTTRWAPEYWGAYISTREVVNVLTESRKLRSSLQFHWTASLRSSLRVANINSVFFSQLWSLLSSLNSHSLYTKFLCPNTNVYSAKLGWPWNSCLWVQTNPWIRVSVTSL